MGNKVIDVSNVSVRGTSIRITLPKKIVRILGIGMDDIVVFKESKDRSVIIEKMKSE